MLTWATLGQSQGKGQGERDRARRDERAETPALERLFDEFGWGTVTLRYEHCAAPGELPADEELAGVHLIPFEAATGKVVIPRADDAARDDCWIMPGGTIEPGETWREAAARELLEETGARMLDVTAFGFIRLHDAGHTRWREHLAWPDSVWVVGWAEVERIGPPQATSNRAERIAEVRCTPIEEAARLLALNEAPPWADICRLAGWLRGNACSRPCHNSSRNS